MYLYDQTNDTRLVRTIQRHRNVFSSSIKNVDYQRHQRTSNTPDELFYRVPIDTDSAGLNEDGTEMVERQYLHQQIKPILTYFRFIGMFPLQQTTSGKFYCKMFSFIMLYSVTFVTLNVSLMYTVGRDLINKLTAETGFTDSIFTYLLLSFLGPCLITPLVWLEAQDIASFVNNWSNYQLLYYKVTGRPLVLSLDRTCSYWLIFNLINSFSCVLVQVYVPQLHLWQTIPYYISLSSFSLLVVLWYVNCKALERAAVQLRTNFKVVFHVTCRRGLITDYKTLWFNLHRLCYNIGNSFYRTIGFSMLSVILSIILACYGAMYEINKGFSLTSIPLPAAGTFFILQLYIICNCAQNATEEVSTGLKQELQAIPLHGLDQVLQNEIVTFIQTITTNHSMITLGEYSIVNRSSFAKILSTLLTYLIVIIQFGENSEVKK